MQHTPTPPPQGAREVRVAVDVGGTFTDFEIFDSATGAVYQHKTPSTPADPSLGLVAGVHAASGRFGFPLGAVRQVLHGTTIATNAVLERKLPLGAVLTTAGFEDLLQIGRHGRRDVYALTVDPPPPLVRRSLCFGVAERVRADGAVETPLDEAGVQQADGHGAAALRDAGARAVAVCLLHAYADPAHERRVGEILAEALPGVAVSLSSDIDPEPREYERLSTTVLNALLVPVVAGYMEKLARRFADERFGAKVYLVQSNGGVAGPAKAGREPARLLLSGPSGGAAAARRLSAALGEPHLVAADMGGTSFDVSVVHGGRVAAVAGGEVDGLPVRLPMVEMRTIGAGGGSVAWVDGGGRLCVGPRSAGADPDPVCYGRGGTEMTVTDANLLLDRLDGARFLGGAMPLDHSAAARAAQAVAAPLGLGAEEAAAGVVSVTNASLAGAIRLSLFEKGLDPADFAVLSFGGDGGMHACEAAEESGVGRVIFPPHASTLSVWGIFWSDIAHDLAASHVAPLAGAGPALAERAARLRDEAVALPDEDGVPEPLRAFEWSAGCRYAGQAFGLSVPIKGAGFSPDCLAALAEGFHRAHRRRFDHEDRAAPVEVMALRLTARGRLGGPCGGGTGAGRAEAAPAATRPVRVGNVWREAAVRRRETVPAAGAAPLAGPAVIEEDYTSIYLPPGWEAVSHPTGAIAARRAPAAPEARGDVAAAEADTHRPDRRVPGGRGIDPVRQEVIRHALVTAAEEMSLTIWRTSRSTVVREILDFSTAVFDAHGRNVAQSARIPVHLNSMSDCLRHVLDRAVPLDRWEEGDVVVTNDPYSGGQHLPDIQTFRPVFVGGERVAIVGTLCHHVDVGGGAAAGYHVGATEVFHEGVRIPPLFLVRRGVPNEAVVELLLHNVRQPDETRGDLRAQVAALGIGARAVSRVAAKYGARGLADAMAGIQDGSERMVRAALAALPDGESRFEDWVDDDGQSDAPIRLCVHVVKRGDRIALDFEGTSAQVPGPVNNTPAMTASAVHYALLAALGGDIPANSGRYRPVELVLPEGGVVNARFPAAVAGRMVVNHRVATAVFGALARFMPDRIPAAYYATSYVYALSTQGPDGGRRVYFDIKVGGWGGHAGGDGASAPSCGLHNNTNAPIEVVEARYPVTFTRYGLIPDPGGGGAAGWAWCANGGWTPRAAASAPTSSASASRLTGWKAAGPARSAAPRSGGRTARSRPCGPRCRASRSTGATW